MVGSEPVAPHITWIAPRELQLSDLDDAAASVVTHWVTCRPT